MQVIAVERYITLTERVNTLRNDYQLRLKYAERKSRLLEAYAAKEAPTELEKAILNLQCMELEIIPYSRAWRWGYKKALRLAIRALRDLKRKEERQ